MKKISLVALLVVLVTVAYVLIDSRTNRDDRFDAQELQKDNVKDATDRSEPLSSLQGRTHEKTEEGASVSGSTGSSHTRQDHQKVVSPEHIQAMIDLGAGSMSEEIAGRVLSAENFNQLVDELRGEQPVSLETEKYQQAMMDYFNVSEAAKYSSDYGLNCNDQICLAYFSATRQADLNKAVDLINSEDAPLHQSGFKALYFAQDAQGRQSVRAVFNADPSLDAIQVKEGGEFVSERVD